MKAVEQHTKQTDFLPKLGEEQQLGFTASEGMQGVGTNIPTSALWNTGFTESKHHFVHGGEQVVLVTELCITCNLIVHLSVYSSSGKGLQGSQSVPWRTKLLNERERIWEIKFVPVFTAFFPGPMILYQHGNMEIESLWQQEFDGHVLCKEHLLPHYLKMIFKKLLVGEHWWRKLL